MKNFFKKMNRGQDVEQDDLNLDYGDFYVGKEPAGSERPVERNSERAEDNTSGGYYDVPKNNTRGGYEEPDFRSDSGRYYDADRTGDRTSEPSESFIKPRETWQENDADGFRPVQREATPEPTPDPDPVFTPSPAPEYLYFTPSTYRDCREGIVKGLATGHVVVVRLRSLEANDVLRLFDYMMGAVLALDGELVRPAATTVVLVPKDVEFDEDELEADDEDEYEDEYEDDEYEDEEEYEGEYEGEYEDEEEYEDEYEEYEDDEKYRAEFEAEEEYEDEYEEDSEEDV